MPSPPSARVVAIRMAILRALRLATAPLLTSEVTRVVTDAVEAGPTGYVLGRSEVGCQLAALARLEKIERYATGETEQSHARRSRAPHRRAARGSVRWAFPGRWRHGAVLSEAPKG